MKTIVLGLFTFLVLATVIKAEDTGQICTVDSSGELAVFICYDSARQSLYREEVEALYQFSLEEHLKSNNVRILDPEAFLEQTLHVQIAEIINGPEMRRNCDNQLEQVYYRVDEFNRLPSSHSVVTRLRALAQALQDSGICDIPVRQENFNRIDVRTSDDLLHHFLCISNSESVFNTRNIGMGGRGPWGIHPMHNQPRGSRAFVDGRTVTLDRNGLCYPSQAVYRDRGGAEIRDNNAYQRPEIIRDNAMCALRLYQRSGSLGGLSAWGTGSSWGSNRHCSKSTRDRLQFMKHLGVLGCCSDACKRRVQDSI